MVGIIILSLEQLHIALRLGLKFYGLGPKNLVSFKYCPVLNWLLSCLNPSKAVVEFMFVSRAPAEAWLGGCNWSSS